MKADIAVSGAIGVVVGAVVFLAAVWFKDYIPLLVTEPTYVWLVFAVLLALALFEMPLMIWGLRRMARERSTPRSVLLGTNAAYTAFASVYAGAFVLATGKQTLAFILTALAIVRFVSGIWIK